MFRTFQILHYQRNKVEKNEPMKKINIRSAETSDV